MKNTQILPTDYQFSHRIDLKVDTKLNLMIQVIALFVVGAMIGIAKILHFPLSSSWEVLPTIGITVGLCIVYMVLHELTHGIVIRILSKTKPTYFLRFPFLCTGSKVYWNLKSFTLIALAPVILWGLVLIPLMLFIPSQFFFSFYVVEILNLASASGDYVQVAAFTRLPKNALIQDNGKETSVFTPSKETE